MFIVLVSICGSIFCVPQLRCDAAQWEPPPVPAKELKDVRCIVEAKRSVQAKFHLRFRDGWVYFSSDSALQRYKAKKKKYSPEANHQLVATGQYRQRACPLSGEAIEKDFPTVSVGDVKLRVLCSDCAADLGKRSREDQIRYVFDAEGFQFGDFVAVKRPKSETSGR
ncbi:MAG: hypothetical protein AAF958_11745 [Planctomycetota bacterium]